MIRELGELLGFHARRDEQTPDGLYKLDVAWREREEAQPLKVFEVEFSDIDRALMRLACADKHWKPEQLYLVVGDDKGAERARKLAERGVFAEMFLKLELVKVSDIASAYENLKRNKELIRRLTKRTGKPSQS
ncbi:MAG: hypothetical protein QXG48_02630 [Thermofilaceae archaeon]